MSTNSSNKNKSRTLAARTDAQEFLRELVNLRDDRTAAERFAGRYGKVFQSEVPMALVQQWAIQAEEEKVLELSTNDMVREYWLFPLRDYVRHLWIGDARTKAWGVFATLEQFFAVGLRGPQTGPWTRSTQWFQGRALPPESECERIFTYLNEATSICENRECPAAYFFPHRRGQKYCSETCAAPAQRQFKTNWWRKHGPKWRTKRKSKTPKAKHVRGSKK